MANEVLANGLRRRLYSSPLGYTNFDPSKGPVFGGYIRPVVTNAAPLELKYKWKEHRLSMVLLLIKEQAMEVNGEVKFRNIYT